MDSSITWVRGFLLSHVSLSLSAEARHVERRANHMCSGQEEVQRIGNRVVNKQS